MSFIHAFLPELVLLAGALGVFGVSLGEFQGRRARVIALTVALIAVGACLIAFNQQALLFDGAYRVDAFSQLMKLVLAVGYVLVLLLSGDLPDIRRGTKSEYHLFLILSVVGLMMLVSSIEIIALVVALELSSFPLSMMIAMRRERDEQRVQMEAAIKYLVFGVAANGVMFFGFSYLFGLTGTTHLPEMFARLGPVAHTPVAIAGLTMALCAFYYKLAIFPFHFWSPDVYQGASNETAGLIASLPKIGAIVALVRLVSLSPADNHVVATLLSALAILSMFYGNLIALVQTDFKRLLGFSAIAHAGYALVGFVTLDTAGYAAALYYMIGYLLMIMACFVVICRISRDGANVAIDELAGLHRRSRLLTVTLVVGVFALAGLPPFVGFMGKFALLSAALAKGHLVLVIATVVNSAIAIYYYLQVIRKGVFGETGDAPVERIVLNRRTRTVCIALIIGIVWLGIAPGPIMDAIAQSLASLNPPL
jgi:NADH-quinone oxidoreductase subunit N